MFCTLVAVNVMPFSFYVTRRILEDRGITIEMGLNDLTENSFWLCKIHLYIYTLIKRFIATRTVTLNMSVQVSIKVNASLL